MRVFNRGRGVLFASLLAPVALYLGFSIEGERIDQRGGHFFETGKNVVTTVGRFARARGIVGRARTGAGVSEPVVTNRRVRLDAAGPRRQGTGP